MTKTVASQQKAYEECIVPTVLKKYSLSNKEFNFSTQKVWVFLCMLANSFFTSFHLPIQNIPTENVTGYRMNAAVQRLARCMYVLTLVHLPKMQPTFGWPNWNRNTQIANLYLHIGCYLGFVYMHIFSVSRSSLLVHFFFFLSLHLLYSLLYVTFAICYSCAVVWWFCFRCMCILVLYAVIERIF